MRLITATVDVIPMNEKGEMKMVYSKDIDGWSTVGGHVELGDSWQSAALNELREEAGIVAGVEDLELVATISGPGEVQEYADGSTQPFSLGFLCRHWKEELSFSDTEEIRKVAWMNADEVRKNTIDERSLLLIDALEKYLETGKVQTVIK